MDVQVTRLDRAYKVSEELDKNTVTKAKTFAEEMARIIHNLNLHWRGDDATLYINKWIILYEKLFNYFSELNKTTNFLQNSFVNMQMCRSRTSSNMKVGDKTTSKYEFDLLEKLDTTSEYYYSEELKTDYLDIEELCNQYEKFAGTTDNNMNELFGNWKIGIGRKEVVNYYQKISNYSKRVDKELIGLRDELATIISNFERIDTNKKE